MCPREQNKHRFMTVKRITPTGLLLLCALLLQGFTTPAEAKTPKKLLVVSVTKGFRHSSIATAEKTLQMLAGKTGDFTPSQGIPIPLSEQRRWLVVPGSAGQPRDGNPAACYAMFDTTSSTLTFHRVPYDLETAGAKIIAAGLPPRLAQRLVHGG